MPLLNLRNIHLQFGGPALLDGVNLSIDQGERICLIGRNGTGKSTLMKVIEGDIKPDDGIIESQQNIKIARLTQEVPIGTDASVYDVTASALGETAELLIRYQHLSEHIADANNDKVMQELADLQHRIEANDGWSIQSKIETVLSKFSLNPTDKFTDLSGGVKRRVLLAQALALEPDLLLLDEPTNHLDIEAITWMEEFLINSKLTILFVTHDRQFLQKLATRIVELDRGKLSNWDCDYNTYLERKEASLESESQQNALFDKKLALEEKWIRQGIKARRTRNEGRVRALKKLREERKSRREVVGKVKVQSQASEQSGKIVIEAKNITCLFEDNPIIKNFSTTILRGDKIGIIGPNGCGKTTLLNLLLGKLKPDEGKIKLGTNLQIAYFDQMRRQLDETSTVIDNVGDGSDNVTINGKSKHIIGYLQDFLFSPERARSPISMLSGGERNRLLLAKLFTKPANLLVLDEPTNDLDVETLELLEELLSEYAGTLLLVSHDRLFINNVVTSSIAYEGDGQFNEYVGGYDDWQDQRTEKKASQKKQPQQAPAKKTKAPSPVKLSYKEQRELENLQKKIEQLESEQEKLHQSMADPAFYEQDNQAMLDVKNRLTDVEKALKQAYSRWEKLES